MLKVLCFGNPNFKCDSLALEVGKKLKGKTKGIEFVECGMGDEQLFETEDNFVVLDVVKGIDRVRFVEPDELKSFLTVTAHDIDVSFYVKLLARMGKRIRIIGIPEGMEPEKASWETFNLLKKLIN